MMMSCLNEMGERQALDSFAGRWNRKNNLVGRTIGLNQIFSNEIDTYSKAEENANDPDVIESGWWRSTIDKRT